MTIEALGRSATAACDGVTTTFTIPFQFQDGGLRIYLLDDADADNADGTLLTEGTHYTIAGSGATAGGASVTTATAYASGQYLRRWRETERDQDHLYTTGPFPAAPSNAALDRLAMVDEEQGDDLARLSDRAVQVSAGETPVVLPPEAERGNKVLGFGADGFTPVMVNPGGEDSDLRDDLADSAAGAALVAFLHRSLQQKAEEEIALADARQSSADDDVDALAELFDDGYRRIRLPAAKGAGEDGEYLIETPNGTSNVEGGAHLIGDGMGRTIVKRVTATSGLFPLFIDSQSDDVNDNLTAIHVCDLTIEDEGAFSEHQHLVWVGGCTDFEFRRVHFKNPRGDALYIGSGNNVGGTTERHNLRGKVAQCLFTGSNQNRNGISVIDCTGLMLQDLWFDGMTKTDGSMPGAIDFEPDASTFHALAAIRGRNLTFRNGGGSCLALLLRPNDYPDAPYNDFQFDGIDAEDCDTILTLFGYTGRNAIAGIDYDARIRNLVARNSAKPYIINGTAGLHLQGSFTDFEQQAELGYTDANSRFTEEVRFERCGTSASGGTNGQLIRAIDTAVLRNRYVDCGRPSGPSGRAIEFSTGDIERLVLDCDFDSPLGRTSYPVRIDAANVNNSNCEDKGSRLNFSGNFDFKPNGSRRYSAAPTSGTWIVGNEVRHSAPAAAGNIGWVCTTTGTLGTLNGGATTGGITSGTATLTVNSATGLAKGQYITIAGVSGVKRIEAISGLVVTIDSNASATVAGAAVAFSAAVFKSFGAIAA